MVVTNHSMTRLRGKQCADASLGQVWSFHVFPPKKAKPNPSESSGAAPKNKSIFLYVRLYCLGSSLVGRRVYWRASRGRRTTVNQVAHKKMGMTHLSVNVPFSILHFRPSSFRGFQAPAPARVRARGARSGGDREARSAIVRFTAGRVKVRCFQAPAEKSKIGLSLRLATVRAVGDEVCGGHVWCETA